MLRKGKSVEEVATMLDMKIELAAELYRLLEKYGDQAENHLEPIAG